MKQVGFQEKELEWVKIHQEYLDLVPRLSKDQYKVLKNSILQDGLQVPIIVNQDGVILDGHTRFQVCKETGVKPTFTIKEFEDQDKEREFVVVTNLARRQLTLFQRAEVCFNFYEKERSNRYQRMGVSNSQVRHGLKPKKTEDDDKSDRLLNRFGRMIGTGPTIAHMLTWLIENADETTKNLLRSDMLTIRTAYRRLRHPKWKHYKSSDYLKHPACLACGDKIESAKVTGCHVHTQYCCTSCKWGN